MKVQYVTPSDYANQDIYMVIEACCGFYEEGSKLLYDEDYKEFSIELENEDATEIVLNYCNKCGEKVEIEDEKK